eukprot:2113779-Rhodomonas_salina.4
MAVVFGARYAMCSTDVAYAGESVQCDMPGTAVACTAGDSSTAHAVLTLRMVQYASMVLETQHDTCGTDTGPYIPPGISYVPATASPHVPVLTERWPYNPSGISLRARYVVSGTDIA